MFKKYFSASLRSIEWILKILFYTAGLVLITVVGVPAVWAFLLVAPVAMMILAPIAIIFGFSAIEKNTGATTEVNYIEKLRIIENTRRLRNLRLRQSYRKHSEALSPLRAQTSIKL
ncbi:MAG: hypothetical protein AABY64_08555 [Bdellovibrionota bacterium]